MIFELNPYEPCMANCMIEGKQCTIVWYVDDSKISHVDPNDVTRVIEQIKVVIGKMTVAREKEHTFLGMHVHFKEDKGIISMKSYLAEAFQESGLDICRKAATPTRKNIFDVNDNLKPLDKIFHIVVAKLLYVATRALMNILLAVGFLCTRVSQSTIEDVLKLKWLLEYRKEP
jgi:predicted amino acid-binding ACT domain protein